LLDTIKEVASGEGLSVNAWVIRALEVAAGLADSTLAEEKEVKGDLTILDIEPILDGLLDKKLDGLVAVKLARIEERLGKLKA
jgi:hypothetical protein